MEDLFDKAHPSVNVECPACRARPGKPCMKLNGFRPAEFLEESHKARKAEWHHRGRPLRYATGPPVAANHPDQMRLTW